MRFGSEINSRVYISFGCVWHLAAIVSRIFSHSYWGKPRAESTDERTSDSGPIFQKSIRPWILSDMISSAWNLSRISQFPFLSSEPMNSAWWSISQMNRVEDGEVEGVVAVVVRIDRRNFISSFYLLLSRLFFLFLSEWISILPSSSFSLSVCSMRSII